MTLASPSAALEWASAVTLASPSAALERPSEVTWSPSSESALAMASTVMKPRGRPSSSSATPPRVSATSNTDNASRSLVVGANVGSPARADLGTAANSRSAIVTRDSRLRPRSAPTKRATKSEAGWASISSGGPNWARRPPSSITAIKSPILIASSMSWVTKMIVLARSCCRRRNSSWRRSRTIGSTAANGSSMSMSGGSAARARATPTRWRSPPDSWNG